MTPKQIAVLDGKVVARTYDVTVPPREFALKFESNSDKFGDVYDFGYIRRDNYFNLKKMIEKVYRDEGTIEWRDASQWNM